MIKNPKGKTHVVRTAKHPAVKIMNKATESGKNSRRSTPPSAQIKSKTSAKDVSLGPESIDMSHEELDTATIVQTTNSIKNQIMDSLQVFKTINSDYMSSNLELQKEVDSFQKDFYSVRNEVNCLLWESSKSKQELNKMKHIIETPKNRVQTLDIDLSSVKESDEEALMDSLKALQEEISLIKGKIKNNEDQIKTKETMNSELRSAVYKLRDSVFSTQSLDTSKKNCCEIF